MAVKIDGVIELAIKITLHHFSGVYQHGTIQHSAHSLECLPLGAERLDGSLGVHQTSAEVYGARRVGLEAIL